MISYDPRGMEWDQYCKLMAELFSADQLGNVPEENWRDWVDGMSGIGYFVQSAMPDQRPFDTWQDWAQAASGIMNIQPTL